MAAVAPCVDDRVGVAVAELSTGSFTIVECRPDELETCSPDSVPTSFCVRSRTISRGDPTARDLAESVGRRRDAKSGLMFGTEEGDRTLREHYRVANLEAFGLIADDPVTRLRALLR